MFCSFFQELSRVTARKDQEVGEVRAELASQRGAQVFFMFWLVLLQMVFCKQEDDIDVIS